MLDQLQALEQAFGRRPKLVLNEPRPLDLDLLTFGGERRSTDRLALPHPRALDRRFVLAPWAEIAPEFRPPGSSVSVAEALASLRTDELVARIPS